MNCFQFKKNEIVAAKIRITLGRYDRNTASGDENVLISIIIHVLIPAQGKDSQENSRLEES